MSLLGRWSDWPLTRKSVLVVAGPLLLLVSVLAIYRLERQTAQAEEDVRRTLGIISDLHEAHSLLAETAAGVRGYVLVREENFLDPYYDAEPRLMGVVNGLAQRLNNQSNRLATANFVDFSFDISNLVKTTSGQVPIARNLNTPALMTASWADLSASTGQSIGTITEEFHTRFSRPLFCIVAAMIRSTARPPHPGSRRPTYRVMTMQRSLRPVAAWVTKTHSVGDNGVCRGALGLSFWVSIAAVLVVALNAINLGTEFLLIQTKTSIYNAINLVLLGCSWHPLSGDRRAL